MGTWDRYKIDPKDPFYQVLSKNLDLSWLSLVSFCPSFLSSLPVHTQPALDFGSPICTNNQRYLPPTSAFALDSIAFRPAPQPIDSFIQQPSQFCATMMVSSSKRRAYSFIRLWMHMIHHSSFIHSILILNLLHTCSLQKQCRLPYKGP